ncbi:amino acid permease [Gluconobacter albidus]|uniref:Amino acid ABC transporter n=1 Tax=Gluconobacter albidus TaxID=318683 RepID=A0AAW3QUZ3_9PROT|nr:amino acid permease [Gluconobacter albidus]KXV37442.1 amino acid ABC transporter [Gluconobacter albidus]MBS1026869.1 amino acid permease [Gluconobacter albidus]GBQ84193.1 amino acid ABC transporter [Gluconobacter albidus NBRC 3250]GLQ70341.1 putative GABA permease GabP [Gluconobacter albidus]
MSQPDQLAHSLRTRHVVMIALGGVIGAGYFIGASAALSLGGPAVLLSYALAGTLVFLVNLMMRDLALKVPGRASFLGQIQYALGARAAFVAGWAYWLTWIIAIAVEVIAVATMLAPYIPLPYAVIEVLIMALMTGVNLMSVKGYGEFEYWFSAIKVLAIVCFIGIGIWALLSRPVPVHENLFAHGGLLPHGWLALLAVIPTILFSMGGSEISTVAAVESDNTEQNIVRATRSIALRIGGFYIVSIALVLCLVPWSDVVPGYSPFLLVLHRLHVPFADVALAVVVMTAALSSLNSGIYVTSRILYELAESGSAPGLFLTVDTSTKLPRRAILVSALASVLVAAVAVLSPTLIFGLLVSLTGGFMVFNNTMIVAGRLKLVRESSWKAYAALVLIACTLIAMLIQPETRSQIILGAGALLLIFAAERFVPRRRLD